MTDPLAELVAALDDEFGRRPRVAALATVDAAGRPRVRNVVCRRIGPCGIWVASDARSAKNAEVRANPAVGLALWLPKRREQFRVLGRVGILDGADRQSAWEGLSDSARSLFAWPAPGTPLVADAFPAAVPADAPIPAAFEVLAIAPESIEILDLNPHPHHRRRFRRAGAGWTVEELNP